MMATRRTPRALRVRRTAIAAGAAVVLVLLSGCSGSSDDGGSASSDKAVAPAAAPADQALEKPGSVDGPADGVADVSTSTQSGGNDAAPGTPVEQQKVISTGNVQLRSKDVGQAIFDVRKVVDVHGGTISEDDTETDKDGDAFRSRMVLRIPTADFDDTMAELEQVAGLVSSKRQSVDVTTQVLDIDVRVEAQQRSIDRIQVLFDHATTIKDIVSIEGELSRRQADLASLEAQQDYLADQTSMSTITLAIERTREETKPKPKDDDEAGFISGLSGGWGAMKTFLVGTSTVAGALLPWLLLMLVLAIPGWPVYRRLRRRMPAAT
jgi:uncharacterized protein DUF4349